MNKEAFLLNVPNFIIHKKLGTGRIEILLENNFYFGVCYRFPNGKKSCDTYGANWKEVSNSLKIFLDKEGYLKVNPKKGSIFL
ncbi:MAG: hypothetical protein H0X62_09960 [Bacteroidetes bacterium]|nr:hypothetical protein [Bacteroidota bacterium]